MDAVKRRHTIAYESILSLVSGLRKVPAKNAEDIAYNNALVDV